MKNQTIITTDNKKVNYDSLFRGRRIKRLEVQVQKLKAWILRNMDPGAVSITEKVELYRLLTL